uniref:Uncharacterized protein n=1 Tax=Thermofilum pendens TaxID=2269 RepID=A0A7J3X6N8_THEPE
MKSVRTSLVILAAVAVALAIAVAVPVLAVWMSSSQSASEAAGYGGERPPAGAPSWNISRLPRFPAKWGFARGWRFVQVSSEYESRVLEILKADPDTSKLLSEGYNVTAIRPLITAVVSGTGDVSLKAARAVVLLRGPSGSAAQVLVDVEQGKVLKIVTLTRTVIEKQ